MPKFDEKIDSFGACYDPSGVCPIKVGGKSRGGDFLLDTK